MKLTTIKVTPEQVKKLKVIKGWLQYGTMATVTTVDVIDYFIRNWEKSHKKIK